MPVEKDKGGLWPLSVARPGLHDLSFQWTCPVGRKELRWFIPGLRSLVGCVCVCWGGVSNNFDVTPVESTELVNLRIACSTHSVAGLGPFK